MVRNVKTFEISMMIFMMIFCYLTHFLFQIISLLSTQTVLVFFKSHNYVSRRFFTMFFSQKFGKRSTFTGSSTQNEHMTQRKTIFQSTTFAYFKGARTREMLSSLLLCKSRTVRCGAICRLTKPFGGTRSMR